MPELPEAETVRRVLEEHFRGRTVTEVIVAKPTFYRRPPQRALAGIAGSELTSVARRGKYLLLRFSGDKELVLHLGMSGRIVINGNGSHTRFTLAFGDQLLKFQDARRFGRVGCALPKLGPEPLGSELDEAYLWKALRGRTAKIKALLLDQRIVAGLGNIYATEALFKSGIRPGRAAGSLKREEVARLCAAIKEVLAAAVTLRGSTLDDEAFLDPLGKPGEAQKKLSAYGRKLGACGHPLKDTRPRIGGRTSLYCSRCQR